jgi:DNA modification methylase
LVKPNRLRIEYFPIDKLKGWSRNPRNITGQQLRALTGNIERYGVVAPIIVNQNNVIVGGHQRLEACKNLGFSKVPVVRLKLTSKDFKVLNLALNRISGDWNQEKLATLVTELQDFPELDLTGLTQVEIEELLAGAPITDLSAGREDEVSELPTEPATKQGDLWQLGKHRILCGDCTKSVAVERLMGGIKVDCVVTDPPYGFNLGRKSSDFNKYMGRNRGDDTIKNDDIQDYRLFYGDFIRLLPLAERNIVYIFMGGRELHTLRLAADESGLTWNSWLVWVKNRHTLTRKDYEWRHEFIYYGWQGQHKFYGGFSTTILEYDSPLKADLHPTMKPVPLIERLIQDGSPTQGAIYDGFLGSGSTIIAAERCGRTCYALEIDPRYVDVTVQRWEQYTGRKAELVQP